MTGTRTVGWYVHHHGGGHLARFLAVRPHVDAEVVCFSSAPAPVALPPRTRWVQLPRDDDAVDVHGAPRDPAAGDPTVGGLLHWAPLLHDGHRRRLAVIAEEAVAARLTAFVVDVSVEVALFVRLLGVPVVVVTQPGERDDAPHALVYRLADRVIAPWPGELLRPAFLDDAPVVYTGGISRHDGRARADSAPSGDVLLLGGGGGAAGPVSAAALDAARAATPGRRWEALGVGGGAWAADPWAALLGARVVVSFAGQNAVADLAAAGARAVVIPQERPFAEQHATAGALRAAGLAVTLPAWPEPEAWPALLARAEAADPQWRRWGTEGAAARAGAVVSEVAGR